MAQDTAWGINACNVMALYGIFMRSLTSLLNHSNKYIYKARPVLNLHGGEPEQIRYIKCETYSLQC